MDEVFFAEEEFVERLPEEGNLAGRKMIQLWREAIRRKRADCQPAFLLDSADFWVRYYAETIREPLKSNKFFFVFDPGVSLIDIAQIFGDDPGKPPCRNKENNGWMLDGSSPWAKESQKPSYCLVSAPLLCGLSGDHQDAAIKDLLGGKFERASCRLAIVLGISHFLAFGNYGFKDCHHLGPETSDFGGVRTHCVSAFGSSGFALYNFPQGAADKGIGVCLMRKFDF